MEFYLASVALFVAVTAGYSIVTQRLLRAAGKPASWVLALTLGGLIALVTTLTPHSSKRILLGARGMLSACLRRLPSPFWPPPQDLHSPHVKGDLIARNWALPWRSV